MKKLIKGIIDFRKKALADYRAKFSKLARGQSPDVLFFACCDSRVVPNVFASTDPGDLFVMRNIGNLVPPFATQDHHLSDTSVAAAIEFSLNTLNVNHIVICGHSECAAMMQFFTDSGLRTGLPNLDAWLKYAAPAYERFKANHAHQSMGRLSPHNVLSQINVLQQLDHLKSYPSIKERLENKTLHLHGWWFELATADVYQHEAEANDFLLIDAQHAEKILASL